MNATGWGGGAVFSLTLVLKVLKAVLKVQGAIILFTTVDRLLLSL